MFLYTKHFAYSSQERNKHGVYHNKLERRYTKEIKTSQQDTSRPIRQVDNC